MHFDLNLMRLKFDSLRQVSQLVDLMKMMMLAQICAFGMVEQIEML